MLGSSNGLLHVDVGMITYVVLGNAGMDEWHWKSIKGIIIRKIALVGREQKIVSSERPKRTCVKQ